MIVRLLVTVCLVLMAVDAVTASPLFASHDPLVIRIEAPMRQLIENRMEKPDLPAVVVYEDGGGRTVSVAAEISSRGSARLEACDFPPIKLDFDKVDTTGTVFEGQGELKLVTQCSRGKAPKSWVHQEYGIYRAYNLLTDASFRVRWLDVTYQDDSFRNWNRDGPAFVIESVDASAARLDRIVLRPPEVRPEQFDAAETASNILFQYLIGNTDFAVKRGPSGEGCCHNGRVIAPAGAQQDWIVLPYDFDQAGIINTEYAVPDSRFRIRGVTERLYRGFCWHNDVLPDVIERFNELRDEITAALTPDDISRTRKRRINRYVNGFYDVINDQRELQDELLDQCRGDASFSVRKTTSAGQ